jgi:hypothetical protein
MRQKKFLELVSAWMDGELSPDEEILLKEALRKNPEYRMIFDSYRRMNVATARARFPVPRPVERRFPFTSTFSWAISGVAAGVACAAAFIAMREPPSAGSLRVTETAAFEAPANLAVYSDEKTTPQRSITRVHAPLPGMVFAGLSVPVTKKTAGQNLGRLPGVGEPGVGLHSGNETSGDDILSRDFSVTLASCGMRSSQ